MISFEVVTTPARFQAIARSWHGLWSSSNATAFQSHGWIATWLRHCGPEYRLHIGLAWDDDRLVCVLPCAVRRYNGIRMLEWAAQMFSDHCDGFGDPGMLANLWIKSTAGIDVVHLKNMMPSAQISALLATTPGLLRSDDLTLKVASQWPDGAAWFKTLNKKKRNNHARGRRMLDEMGSVQIDYLTEVPDQTVTRLIELKRGWLRAQNLSSPLLDSGPVLLHELVAALVRVGKLCFAQITCNGEIVAGSINIVEGNRMLAFFAAYDPQYDRASPGIMLMVEYTRWAFDHGFTEIDYLRGDEGYKYEFANAEARLQSLIGATSLIGHGALAAFRIGRRIKARGTPEAEPPRSYGGAYTTQAGTSRLQATVSEQASDQAA